jgi:hypothetical protein
MFKPTNVFSMTPRQIQEKVAETGLEASYIAGNQTEAIQNLTNGAIDVSKGAFSTDSAARLARSSFKGAKDYTRGDLICTGLCAVSAVCETAAGILVWVPIPGKICTLAALKSVSKFSITFRDLCAGDPTNPLC